MSTPWSMSRVTGRHWIILNMYFLNKVMQTRWSGPAVVEARPWWVLLRF